MADSTRIIIDTDPGQDDAVAILLALASPELDVLAITTVAGNVPLDLTTRNARIVCELAGRRDIKIFAGADAPLQRKLVTAEHVHGKTGLDGPPLPEPQMQVQQDGAVEYLIRTLHQEPEGSVTLCTLGPLTNIALALRQSPEIAPRIAAIVMMGGGFFEGGNITPAAEFNIFVDPHAASIVFASGVPIIMHPLDVTHQVMTTAERTRRIRSLGSRPAIATAGFFEFAERFDKEKYGTDGGPLHDPNVIAYLLAPELYQGRDCNVEIETQSELTMGMSVVDWWGVTDRPANARVIRTVDANGFFELLTERLGRYRII